MNKIYYLEMEIQFVEIKGEKFVGFKKFDSLNFGRVEDVVL